MQSTAAKEGYAGAGEIIHLCIIVLKCMGMQIRHGIQLQLIISHVFSGINVLAKYIRFCF